MKILRSSLDSLDLLVPLFDQYRQFYKQRPDLQGARAFLSDRLRNGDSVVYIAFEDPGSKPLGFVQLYPSFSSVAMKPLWILNDLFVTPVARGHGVAEALIHQSIKHAQQTNARGIVLETAVDNAPARRLYEKLGWLHEEGFLTYKIDFQE
ncbi:MAG: GNAT family N-acetyltransferase [Bacteroidota bacterium]